MLRSKINFSIIFKIIGILLIIEGFFIFLCLPFSIYYGSEDFYPILNSGLITVCVGLFLWFVFRNASNKNIGKKNAYIIVTSVWLIMSVFGTLPYILSGEIPNFTDAFFETISGFTTTGASILTDVESVSKGVLFWRSMTHWIGGMGIIVLSIAILPILGVGGMQLFIAETSPGTKPEKLHPRIKETAQRLWGIYVLLTFFETGFLMLGHMNLFDALCHSFGTIATGGFSTQNSSIANYSSYIQYVIIFFMFLSGTNFTLHYFSLHGKFKKVFKNEEYKWYAFILFSLSIIITFILFFSRDITFEKAFRDSLFQVVSIGTCTGFATTDYMHWPVIGYSLIFFLMFSGGSVGSTSGGIKIMRHVLLFKNIKLQIKKIIHPTAVIPLRLNEKPVSKDIVTNVIAFFIVYFITFIIGSIILISSGLDLDSAMGGVASCLGGIGPGLGSVGPVSNYAEISIISKWTLSVIMLLGRLELFSVIILFSRSFWRK